MSDANNSIKNTTYKMPSSFKSLVNPICVLTRPDCELSSIFHSFFLLSVRADNTAEVRWRVPERRARIEDVESGLGIFINDIVELHASTSDMFGTFVITTSDGTRFFAFWRGAGDFIFVAVRH